MQLLSVCEEVLSLISYTLSIAEYSSGCFLTTLEPEQINHLGQSHEPSGLFYAALYKKVPFGVENAIKLDINLAPFCTNFWSSSSPQ